MSSTWKLGVRVNGDPAAVHRWWTDPRRLEEIKAAWSSRRDFRWHELQESDRTEIATAWTSGSGTEIAMRVTIYRVAFPHGKSRIVQRRQHLTGREDLSTVTTDVEFCQLAPSVTEVRVTMEREHVGRRWWELRPPFVWLVAAAARRQLRTRAARCEAEVAREPR